MLKIVTDKATCDDETFSLERKQGSYKDCKHMPVLVDPVLRVVTCKACGEKLDPIEVCLNFINWTRQQEAHFTFIRNAMDSYRKKEKEKDANRRTLCRRCRKMFVERPNADGVFAHCGICDPCWEKSPVFVRED